MAKQVIPQAFKTWAYHNKIKKDPAAYKAFDKMDLNAKDKVYRDLWDNKGSTFNGYKQSLKSGSLVTYKKPDKLGVKDLPIVKYLSDTHKNIKASIETGQTLGDNPEYVLEGIGLLRQKDRQPKIRNPKVSAAYSGAKKQEDFLKSYGLVDKSERAKERQATIKKVEQGRTGVQQLGRGAGTAALMMAPSAKATSGALEVAKLGLKQTAPIVIGKNFIDPAESPSELLGDVIEVGAGSILPALPVKAGEIIGARKAIADEAASLLGQVADTNADDVSRWAAAQQLLESPALSKRIGKQKVEAIKKTAQTIEAQEAERAVNLAEQTGAVKNLSETLGGIAQKRAADAEAKWQQQQQLVNRGIAQTQDDVSRMVNDSGMNADIMDFNARNAAALEQQQLDEVVAAVGPQNAEEVARVTQAAQFRGREDELVKRLNELGDQKDEVLDGLYQADKSVFSNSDEAVRAKALAEAELAQLDAEIGTINQQLDAVREVTGNPVLPANSSKRFPEMVKNGLMDFGKAVRNASRAQKLGALTVGALAKGTGAKAASLGALASGESFEDDSPWKTPLLIAGGLGAFYGGRAYLKNRALSRYMSKPLTLPQTLVKAMNGLAGADDAEEFIDSYLSHVPTPNPTKTKQNYIESLWEELVKDDPKLKEMPPPLDFFDLDGLPISADHIRKAIDKARKVYPKGVGAPTYTTSPQYMSKAKEAVVKNAGRIFGPFRNAVRETVNGREVLRQVDLVGVNSAKYKHQSYVESGMEHALDVLKKNHPDEYANFYKILEGKVPPQSDAAKALVQQWRNIANIDQMRMASLGVFADGTGIKPIDNYVPKQLSDEFSEALYSKGMARSQDVNDKFQVLKGWVELKRGKKVWERFERALQSNENLVKTPASFKERILNFDDEIFIPIGDKEWEAVLGPELFKRVEGKTFKPLENDAHKAFENYFDDAAHKFALHDVLGRNFADPGSRFSNLVTRARAEMPGDMAKNFDDRLKAFLSNKWREAEGSRFASHVTNIMATKLGLAWIPNMTQWIATSSKYGVKASTRGYIDALRRQATKIADITDSEINKQVASTGLLDNKGSVVLQLDPEKYSSAVSDFMLNKLTPMADVERLDQWSSAAAALHAYTDLVSLLRGEQTFFGKFKLPDKLHTGALWGGNAEQFATRKLMKAGLTPDEIAKLKQTGDLTPHIGQFVSEGLRSKSFVRTGAFDDAYNFKKPWFRVLALYQNFSSKMGAFTLDEVKEAAMTGDATKLLTLAGGLGAAGLITEEARNLVAARSDAQREPLIKQIWNKLMVAGAFGNFGDTVVKVQREYQNREPNLGRAVGGPVGEAVVEAWNFGASRPTVQKFVKDTTGIEAAEGAGGKYRGKNLAGAADTFAKSQSNLYRAGRDFVDEFQSGISSELKGLRRDAGKLNRKTETERGVAMAGVRNNLPEIFELDNPKARYAKFVQQVKTISDEYGGSMEGLTRLGDMISDDGFLGDTIKARGRVAEAYKWKAPEPIKEYWRRVGETLREASNNEELTEAQAMNILGRSLESNVQNWAETVYPDDQKKQEQFMNFYSEISDAASEGFFGKEGTP